jgi:hypothetical protein
VERPVTCSCTVLFILVDKIWAFLSIWYYLVYKNFISQMQGYRQKTKTKYRWSNLTTSVIIMPKNTLHGYKYRQKNHRVPIRSNVIQLDNKQNEYLTDFTARHWRSPFKFIYNTLIHQLLVQINMINFFFENRKNI